MNRTGERARDVSDDCARARELEEKRERARVDEVQQIQNLHAGLATTAN